MSNVNSSPGRDAVQEQLRASEERFRLIVENVRDYAIFQVDLNGDVTAWNPGAERVLGYEESEILGKSVEVLSIPEDRAAATMKVELERAREEGRAQDERWIVRLDGQRIWCRWITNAIYDDTGRIRGFVKVLADETDRRRAHEQIRTSLREKEALLQEIHHRVKNNLQVVISLLRLQSAYITDEQARLALEETTHRLYSIAEIHEMLYSSDDLARVDFNEYLERLAAQLFALYGTPSDRVRLRVEHTKLLLPIRQAIPCGLIANELLMNALKYAFPVQRSGTIALSCSNGLNHHCVLRVADDGVGFPPEFNWRQAQSMGLRLVRVLADQLGGTLELEPTDVGVSFRIEFPRASPEGEVHEQGASSGGRG